MMHGEGFWWSIGRFAYKCFHGLEWTYAHLSPNKIFIAIGFIAFFSWLWMQVRYTKEAKEKGTIV